MSGPVRIQFPICKFNDYIFELVCLFNILFGSMKHAIRGKFKLTYRNGRITNSVCLDVKNTSNSSMQLTDLYLFNDDITVPLLHVPEILEPGKISENYFTDAWKSITYFGYFEGDVINFALINAALHNRKVNDYVLRYIQLPVKIELIEVHRLDRCCNTQRYLNLFDLFDNLLILIFFLS